MKEKVLDFIYENCGKISYLAFGTSLATMTGFLAGGNDEAALMSITIGIAISAPFRIAGEMNIILKEDVKE